jgi:hypothetical protein
VPLAQPPVIAASAAIKPINIAFLISLLFPRNEVVCRAKGRTDQMLPSPASCQRVLRE